jgi:hypothetical protein
MTTLEEENRDAGERINRIVLYIDDLDRCPEPLVIDVLKAVHLLLAIVTDMPHLGDRLLRSFQGGARGTADNLGAEPPRSASVLQVSTQPGMTPQVGAAGAETARLTTWLDNHLPDWKEAPSVAFPHWVPRVARDSYHLHRT